MHRKKRQNRITEQRKIQKEICRRVFSILMILSVVCTAGLTGCGDKKSGEQTDLISLDEQDTDTKKTDENSGKETKEEKLQTCYVHVCGAVKSPGVYELTADSRLFEAIQMAGGLTEEAAGEALNQAELVEDGSRIYVPTKEEAETGMKNDGTFAENTDAGRNGGADGADISGTADGKVNINTAGKDELMTLSGIGEAKADAVIRYREAHGRFQKIEDLMGVEGIKEGVFQKVKDQIKV